MNHVNIQVEKTVSELDHTKLQIECIQEDIKAQNEYMGQLQQLLVQNGLQNGNSLQQIFTSVLGNYLPREDCVKFLKE